MTLQDTIPSLLSTKPKNNLFYTKAETIQLINRTKEGTLMRGELIDAILKRKLIPVSRATMYRVLKRHKDNLPVIHDNWDDPTGRPPILDNENFKEFVSRVSKDSGKTRCYH